MKKFYYLTDIGDNIKLKDNGTIEIEVFREGRWNHPKYGVIKGDKKIFQSFIDNWKNNVLGRDIIFDKNHNPDDGGTGIVKNLYIKGDRLKAEVELTTFGKDLIENKGFRYFSPEYVEVYTDKESKKKHGPTLMGGALTLRPFLTNLAPVTLSEELEHEIEGVCFKEVEESDNKNLEEIINIAIKEIAEEQKMTEEEVKSVLV